MQDLAVWTIGHSSHPWERFDLLLQGANISAVGDVRSSPFSRFLPHFNRDELRERLRERGVSYVFLGKELGGRPNDPNHYANGAADYEKMATTSEFNTGLNRTIEGARKHRIALMCAERDPLDCHRCLLVGRALAKRGIHVNHIMEDGRSESHDTIEERLLEISGLAAEDLFASRSQRLEGAYRERARKIAYAEFQDGGPGAVAAE